MRTPDPDQELIEACQRSAAGSNGLEGPFGALYERHKDRVYSLCFRLTGSDADALDAAQEAFCTAFRSIGSFRFGSRFSSWIYRIAVNASIDLGRRARARRLVALRSAFPLREDPEGEVADLREECPSSCVDREEREMLVQRALDRLSPMQRAAVLLRYFENLPYGEIAEILEVPVGTVKSRLFRAHGNLARELAPLMGPP
ncbi:MAG: sigma-70 family RNA polymerase sigma factor [Planctomycetota bacterium]|nr:sigma-70 family RNA polymerase sigma factor [Planctomycetota bacterium]